MDFIELQNLYVFIYKLASLSVGMLTIYLGYSLFIKGIYAGAGDLLAKSKGGSDAIPEIEVTLKKAAPGTFFALFGMLVIAFTLMQGISYSGTTSTKEINNAPVDIVIPEP